MDKYNARKDVVSGARMNNVSKGRDKTKCDSPMLLSISYGNIRSRYLTETTGSCHDLCKYGKKHESERGGKHLTFRRFIANSIASEDVHIIVKDLNVADGKKKSVIMTTISDTCEVAEQNIEPKKLEISDMMTLSSKHEDNICYSQSILSEDLDQHTGSLAKEIGLADNSNIVFEPHLPSHKNAEPVKEILAQAMDDVNDQPQISPIGEAVNKTNVGTNAGLRALLLEDEKFEISPQVIHSEPVDEEINHVKFSNSFRNKEHVNKPKASVVPKITPSKSIVLKQKKSSGSTEAKSGGHTSFFKEKVLSNLKDSTTCETLKAFKLKNTVACKLQSSNQNDFFSPKKTNGSAKTAASLTARFQMNALRSLNDPTNPGRQSISDVGEMKSLKSWRAAISSRALAHSAAVSLKARKSNYIKHATPKKTMICKVDYGDIHEKKLEVFKPKSEGKNLEPNQESFSKESVGHAFESVVNEVHKHSLSGTILRKHQCSFSKEGEKRRPRKPQVVPPANGSSSPYKLNFKRGKVIELRAAESVGPRRLRFRRGRDLGENPSGEVMKIFRRKRNIGDSNDFKSESHDFLLKKANTESKGVKLKHQSLQGNKKIPALSNHAIEERASELVKANGMVKALVGAFESVIFLQESKPASV
ncbi:hypothetical protein KSP39_PZI019800 [Platanthera zijinensis]|uniref:Calmodulin-binding domain-containing protein n=1 Tax=Platanthera zijinensis TaxID=2320716 RepID=A0AAP0FY30_9ASPA